MNTIGPFKTESKPGKVAVTFGVAALVFLAIIGIGIAVLMLAGAIKLAASDWAAQAGVVAGLLVGAIWIARLINK